MDFFGLNEIIWLSYIFLNFSFILFAFRRWGKIGLFMFVPLSIIVANIQVNKLAILFGFEVALGNVAYGGIFLIGDILAENYGKKYAKTIVGIGFLTMLFMTLVMNVASFITPASADTAQVAIERLFTPFYRFLFASLVAYGVSTYLDMHLYSFIKKIIPSYKHIWIKSNTSTIISQIIDSSIFSIIAFAGVYEPSTIISIIFSTYFLKLIISACNTPFVYIATYWKQKGIIKEIDETI